MTDLLQVAEHQWVPEKINDSSSLDAKTKILHSMSRS